MKTRSCLELLVVALPFWAGSVLFSLDQSAFAGPDRSAATDSIDWKFLFNQLFALEIKKEMEGEGYPIGMQNDALQEHLGYTPYTFNESIDRILEADTSSMAYEKRLAIFGSQDNVNLVLRSDFLSSIPDAIRRKPRIASYLSVIDNQRKRSIQPNENFFLSPEGRNAIQGLTRDGSDDVALVLIPGYAAHAIKFEIFPEILSDMNSLKERPPTRPLLDEGNGFDLKFESPKKFYGRTKQANASFDILHPAGMELGNTVGYNAETADLMAQWIRDLPAQFGKKKLILLGYSKGAPTIFEMLQKHPDLKSRVIGVVTFCGVVQGTNIARQVKSQVGDVLGIRTIGDLVERIRKKGTKESLTTMAPFMSPLDLGFTKVDRIKQALAMFGLDTSKLADQVDRFLNGRELKELLDGIDDLSPLTRTRWNLKYLNDNLVAPGTFVFNTSAITDISSFASSRVSRVQKRRDYALIAPKLDEKGRVNWNRMSLDSVFLYLTSIGGFQLAPGGLYDTQVDLQNTKTPWLDQSPLSTTLLGSEIKELWESPEIRNLVSENGIKSYESFRNTPRSDLVSGGRLKHLKPYDLGEFKGHHWSLFLQAFRAPPEISKDFAVWDFPRKAYMRALIQTMAFYRLVNEG
jgi:pimeloyl-ACP methyl ester carboxylesterase